jgi:AraC family transcriptional regulator, exoenzyme S synthesis regulatory protein ExsA
MGENILQQSCWHYLCSQFFFLYNLYTHISINSVRFRRFTCGDSLLTIFNCGEKNKYEDLWSHNNYIIYVVKGRKIWHTAHGSYDLREGSCVFVRKGACIIEQFFDTEFCFFLFFVTDEFICEVLKHKLLLHPKIEKKYDPVISLDNNITVQIFFQSMMAYFDEIGEPDQSILELKFRELILILVNNTANRELLCYCCSLLYEPQNVSLQRVMEDNFCFNLKQKDFAKLSSRSLSAFKRDFQQLYNIAPGKWLMEKRLHHAMHLLTNAGKTVAETAFESGFESASHFSRAFSQHFNTSPSSMKQEAAALG